MRKFNILMIGCGAVGQSLLELWIIDKSPFNKFKITVIEPKDINPYILSLYPKLNHIKVALTKENMNDVITPYINKDTIMIDVSVNVDSIDLMKICKKNNSIFINTSIEDYKDHPHNQNIEIGTLYERGLQADKLNRTADSTMLHSNGCNPGLVNAFVFYALEDYTNKYGDRKDKELLKNHKFNLLSEKLGLDTIHISEIDDQETDMKLKDKFINTWSAIGFQEESLDKVQIVGMDDSIKKELGFMKSKLKPHIYISNDIGMNTEHNSICCSLLGRPIKYNGYMIPHYEPFSLAEYLCNKKYCPNIYYVYKCCPIADKSLELIRKNNYKIIDGYVLNAQDIKSGSDNVGVTLYFNNGKVYWCGSCLSINKTKSMGFRFASPTTIQVAISMTRALQYILNKAQHKKVITTEEIPYNYMIESCKKYLGNFYCKEI